MLERSFEVTHDALFPWAQHAIQKIAVLGQGARRRTTLAMELLPQRQAFRRLADSLIPLYLVFFSALPFFACPNDNGILTSSKAEPNTR